MQLIPRQQNLKKSCAYYAMKILQILQGVEKQLYKKKNCKICYIGNCTFLIVDIFANPAFPSAIPDY